MTGTNETQQTFPMENIKEQTQKALDNCQPALALQFLSRALQQDAEDPQVLELTGIAYMDYLNAAMAGTLEETGASFPDNQLLNVNDPDAILERAVKCFMASVERDPNHGYAKYLYLGQMTSGSESIQFYSKGLELLQAELAKETSNKQAIQTIKRKLSSTCCSIIEIYMTDCCELEEAESQCESFIQQAVHWDPENTEVYQSLASIRLSQSNLPAAKEAIEKAISLWANLEANDSAYPTFPVRFGQAKLCIECGLYDTSLDILFTVQRENDEDPEVWYVLGWCYFLQAGGSDELEALPENLNPITVAAFEDAKECLMNVFMLNEKEPVDEFMFSHVQAIVSYLEKVLSHATELGIAPAEEECEDEDWEDME